MQQYKKTDPEILEEEEMVQNLFNCLCASLQLRSNQELFRQAEGLELMLIMIKYDLLIVQFIIINCRQKKICRKPALKVVDFALTGNAENCEHFVNALGLKTLFAAFMKKVFFFRTLNNARPLRNPRKKCWMIKMKSISYQ